MLMALRPIGHLAVAVTLAIPVALRARTQGTADVSWRPDAELTRLFTPPSVPPRSCEVSVSEAGIEAVAAALRTRPGADPDAWQVVSAGLTDAFGTEGPYDRARLARLINGGRIRIARGSITTTDGTIGYTLVSPVPGATFESLRSGTMIVTVDVRRMVGRGGE